jgi:hypothetical protein
MHNRILSAALAALLVNLVCYGQGNPKEVEAAAKVKAAVFKIGAGSDTLVKVRLRDGTELKGYISEANEDGFVMAGGGNGSAASLKYHQVKQVKPFQSRGRKFGNIAGYVALFALIAVLGISYARKDGCGSCAPSR